MPAEVVSLRNADAHATLLSEEILGLPTAGDVFWSNLPDAEHPYERGGKLRPAIVLALVPRAQALSIFGQIHNINLLSHANAKLRAEVERYMGESRHFVVAAKCTTRLEMDGIKRTPRDGRLHLGERKNFEPMGLDKATMAEFAELRLVPLDSAEIHEGGHMRIVGALSKHDMKRAVQTIGETRPDFLPKVVKTTYTTMLPGETTKTTFLLNSRLRMILDRGFDPREKPAESWRDRQGVELA